MSSRPSGYPSFGGPLNGLSPKGRGWGLVLLVLALCATAVSLVVLPPALNNSDYHRVTRSLGLLFQANGGNAMCIPFAHHPSLKPPASPLALLGVIVADLSRLFGRGCFSLRVWFLLLSAIYWSGVGAISLGHGARRPVAVFALALLAYLLVAPFFTSFYEEAFLMAFAPFAVLLSLQTRWKAILSAVILFLIVTSKAQAVFFAPALLLMMPRPRDRAQRSRWLFLCCVLVFSVGLSVFKSQHINGGVPNNYDRIYNGLGWIQLDVAKWRQTTFGQRRDHFAAIRPTLSAAVGQRCSPPGKALMGTSYWPVGKAIITSGDPANVNARSFIRHLGVGTFAACLWQMPAPWRVPGDLARVVLKSDYSTHYILPQGHGGVGRAMSSMRSALLRHGAWLALLLAGAALLFGRDRRLRLVIIYVVIATPVLTWLGDGFYEFEKHMMPNFAFLFACVMITLARGRAEATQSAQMARAD